MMDDGGASGNAPDAEKAAAGGRRRATLGNRLRAVLLAGVAALLPIVLAVYVIVALFRWVDGLLRPVLAPLFPGGQVETGAGVLATLLLVLLVGLLVSNYVGRQAWGLVERLFRRLPVASSVYGTAKQFLDAFGTGGTGAFQRAALIEYPRPGLWSLVLISGESAREIEEAAGEDDMVNVFLMTAPNPTTGFLLMVPRRDVRLLDISVEEAMRMIISAGVVNPDRAAGTRTEAAGARRVEGGRRLADAGDGRGASPATTGGGDGPGRT